MDERKLRKELSKAEKAIARLDEKKTDLNAQLLSETDADEALRLHNELTEVTGQLAEIEDRWCELQEQLESATYE